MDRQPEHDTRTVRLAMLQARAEPLALTENLALVDASALEAREAGADLLLTPELFATGYAPARIAESVSAASVAGAHESLRAIAANRGIALAFSPPGPGPADEREITATLVDKTGTVILGYAKSHLFGPAERLRPRLRRPVDPRRGRRLPRRPQTRALPGLGTEPHD